jgi:Fur family ferric uptake transcriptional regulator
LDAQQLNSGSELRRMIRTTGLKGTVSRIAVLAEIMRAEGPLTHGELAEELNARGFDQATVYRNLIDLAKAGVLARIDLGDHVWRFEFRNRGQAPWREHPHFVCNKCGTVSCMLRAKVSISPRPGTAKSGIANVSEVLLRGCCEHC